MQGSYKDILNLAELAWDDTHALLADFHCQLTVLESADKRNALLPPLQAHLEANEVHLLFTDRMLAAIWKLREKLLSLLR